MMHSELQRNRLNNAKGIVVFAAVAYGGWLCLSEVKWVDITPSTEREATIGLLMMLLGSILLLTGVAGTFGFALRAIYTEVTASFIKKRSRAQYVDSEQ